MNTGLGGPTNTSWSPGERRRLGRTGANVAKPRKKSNSYSKKKSKDNFKTRLIMASNKYEHEVRSVAESLSVYGGRDGSCADDVHSMALHQQVPTDRLLAWMCYLKSEIARSHFKVNIFNRDPIPEISWEPVSDVVPRLPFCCSECVTRDSSRDFAKLKEINNTAP